MASKTKKSRSSEFKNKVAVAAIKGTQTQAQLCSQFGIHSTQITNWKKQAIDAIKDSFSQRQKHKQVEHTELIEELYKQIGHGSNQGNRSTF